MKICPKRYVRITTNSGCLVKYLYLCLAFWVLFLFFLRILHASRNFSMKRMSFVKLSPSVCFSLFAFAYAIFVILWFDLILRKTDLFFVFMGFIELQLTTNNTTIWNKNSKPGLQKTKAKLYIKNIITVFRKLCSFFIIFSYKGNKSKKRIHEEESDDGSNPTQWCPTTECVKFSKIKC